MKRTVRRAGRLLVGGTVGAIGGYWLLRYLRPRHSSLTYNGAVALLPDSQSAISVACAVALAKRGARLALAGKNVEQLEALRAKVDPYAADVVLVLANWHEETGQMAIVEQTLQHYDRVDLLVIDLNGLSSGLVGALKEQAVLKTLTSVVGLTRQLLPSMRSHRAGMVTCIAPIGGGLAAPGLAVSSTTVHGWFGLAAALRRELFGSGIEVVTVLTGPTEVDPMPDALIRWLKRNRFPVVTPDAVAETTLNGLLNGQPELFVGGPIYRLLAGIERHMPWLIDLLWRAANTPDWLAAAHATGSVDESN